MPRKKTTQVQIIEFCSVLVHLFIHKFLHMHNENRTRFSNTFSFGIERSNKMITIDAVVFDRKSHRSEHR